MAERAGSSAAPPWIERHPIACLAIVAVALGAYSGSFGGAFVFDDLHWIVENDLVRDLRHFLLEPAGYRKQPNRFVGHLTFALNYRLGGLEVTGYHVFNFCVHALNALLVYALAIFAFRTPRAAGSRLAPFAKPIAFLAAVLFVAHPIQTQAVSYVVQRYTSLSATFYLSTVVLYLRWRLRQLDDGDDPRRDVVAYAAMIVTTLLAMKTKESTFTLPVALAASECFFFGATRRGLLRLVPLLATLAVIPATKLDLSRPVDAVVADVQRVTVIDSKASRLDYARTQLAVVVEYLRLLVLPVGQSVDHDHPVYRSFVEPRVIASALVIALLYAVAAYAYVRTSPRRSAPADPGARVLSFGIVWFFLAISVESSVIPIADVMVEHRVYLPSAGFFLAVAVAAAWLMQRWSPARAGTVLRAAAVVLGLLLGVATFQRNEVWADDVALWTDAAAKSPHKARPHYNVGEALGKRGDLDGAIREYLLALQADPEHARARYNLGESLAKRGDIEGAMRQYQLVIATDPGDARAHNNLGVAYYSRGLVDDAIARFRTAIALSPDYAEAHTNLGIAYGRKGWLDAAQQEMSLGMRLQASGKRRP
jgi:tetratricopeptide (TPR) repeat protein